MQPSILPVVVASVCQKFEAVILFFIFRNAKTQPMPAVNSRPTNNETMPSDQIPSTVVCLEICHADTIVDKAVPIAKVRN